MFLVTIMQNFKVVSQTVLKITTIVWLKPKWYSVDSENDYGLINTILRLDLYPTNSAFNYWT